MLELNGLCITLGEFSVSADVTIPAGGVTALMGASGSGKSTILSAVAGFLTPAAGRITIGGQDMTDRTPSDRPLSILFQDNNLFPHLSVAQNVGLGLRPDLKLSPDQMEARREVLARVGLEGLDGRKPRDLSGGQQSRAALARALLRGRQWLLLDEPFSALGPALRADMLALVRQTARDEGLSVLMVTHDPADARTLADHTCVLADGTLADPVPTAELFENPTPALRAYLG